jgi:hypothetical protein
MGKTLVQCFEEQISYLFEQRALSFLGYPILTAGPIHLICLPTGPGKRPGQWKHMQKTHSQFRANWVQSDRINFLQTTQEAGNLDKDSSHLLQLQQTCVTSLEETLARTATITQPTATELMKVVGHLGIHIWAHQNALLCVCVRWSFVSLLRYVITAWES